MQFVIPHDHPSLPGHFPGRPVVPGVVLLDRVSALLEAELGAGPWRLPQVKFLQPLLPGQTATIALERLDDARYRFRVSREDTLLASGEFVRDRGADA